MSLNLEIEIVDATADWDQIHDLLHRAFASMEGRIDPPSSLHRLAPEDLATKAAMHACLTASLEVELVGCLFVEDRDDVLYLEKLAVEPDHQGSGIGSALVQAATMIAQSLGKDRLQVQTRVELTENHAAFAKMGFVETRRTSHEGFDRPTSITMEKRL